MIKLKILCEEDNNTFILEVESLDQFRDVKCPTCGNDNIFIQDIEYDFEVDRSPLKLGNNGKPSAWG